MTNLLDETRTGNAETPKWLILHRPSEPQRRSWGADMARLVDDLIEHGWVVWREGQEVHVKHRAWVHQC
jgi:hypothetical protein